MTITCKKVVNPYVIPASIEVKSQEKIVFFMEEEQDIKILFFYWFIVLNYYLSVIYDLIDHNESY